MGIFRRNKIIRAAHTSPYQGSDPSPAAAKEISHRQQDWQSRVLAYRKAIPEMAAARKFIRNNLDRVVFKTDIEDETIRQSVEDKLAGFRAGRIGELIFLIGEGNVGYEVDGNNLKWSTYSPNELKLKDGQIHVTDAAGVTAPLAESSKLFKIWEPDTEDRHKAWSPHESLLDILEAWYMYQLVDIAISKSRLASAGILYVPSDGLTDDNPDESGKYPEGSVGYLAQTLVDSMRSSIRSLRNDESFLPFIQFGKADHADSWRHIILERTDDPAAFSERMNNYRERYAGGIDLPREIVLGIGDSNHWTAWKVDDNTWKHHLLPSASLIGDALLANFVVPFAAQLGYTKPIKITPDGTEIIGKPDQSEKGIELAKLDRITDEGLAELTGVDPEFIKPAAEGFNRVSDPTGLSVGVRQQPPSDSMMSSLLQAALHVNRDRVLQLPAEYQKLDDDYAEQVQALLVSGIPKIVSARVSEVKAQSLEQLLTTLQTQVRQLSEKNVLERLARIEASIGLAAGSLSDRYQQELRVRSNKSAALVAAYVDFVAHRERVSKQSQGDKVPPIVRAGDDYRPHDGLIRSLVDVQNGGSGVTDAEWMRLVVEPADVNTDPLVKDTLDAAGVERQAMYTWVYGDPSTRHQPYPAHMDLSGLTWPAFAKATDLFNDGVNEASIYFPGDHAGCQCQYDIVWT